MGMSDASPCLPHGNKDEFYILSVCISLYSTVLTMNKSDFSIRKKIKVVVIWQPVILTVEQLVIY